MAEIMDAFWAQPPIARTFAGAVFGISALCYSGIIPFGWFHFEAQYHLLRLPPQIWRLVTCFMITHPKLSIVMDPYFLFSYMKQIEVGNPRFPRREDVVWYLVCVGGFIMVSCGCLLRCSAFCSVFALLYSSASAPHNICPDSALFDPSAITVPGNEGDYPQGLWSTRHSHIYIGLVRGSGFGWDCLWMTCAAVDVARRFLAPYIYSFDFCFCFSFHQHASCIV